MLDLLASAGLVPVRRGQPLPVHPGGSVRIGPAASLLETSDGGVVSLWGMVSACWDEGDVVGRRLAAVTLVATGAATQGEVATAFGVDDATLRRWSRAWEREGTDGLRPDKRGPKRASKLTDDLAETIRGLRRDGKTLAAIAEASGVSTDTVRRAIAGEPSPSHRPATSSDLVPLARPKRRDAERALAHAGLLQGAEPVICEGASLPSSGALLILPALGVTGLLDAARAVYGLPRAAFYSLRSLLLTLVFSCLLGEPRVEGLSRVDPVAIGRLIGLDRAPEVGTMRRRMEALCSLRRAGDLFGALARHHAEAHPEAMGILYVDGHVRAYHGGSDLPRAHLARARIAMAATTDTWLADASGDAVLVWSSPPGAALTGELKEAARVVRDLLGEDAHPTIAFDRGGWSPACFAELQRLGFDILTYKKGPLAPEPKSAFVAYEVQDRFRHAEEYWLADRNVRVPYDGGRRYFACRQVTRRDPASGHQTQILATRRDVPTPEIATSMFGRWREENLFRFMRPRGLDAMDSYAKLPDDPERLVPNRAKAKAKAELKKARATLATAEAAEGRVALRGDGAGSAELRSAYAQAKKAVEEMEAAYRAIPAKVPLAEARPEAVRLDDERKRIHDAIRMATWNAESTLARALGPHYARAEDEAHSLIAEAFRASADLEITGNKLHVRLDPLSAPRRSRAIAALCTELTATKTLYPGTKLQLVFSVKGY
jgi:prepilin-type processing-associated H-X9-DG protein